MKNVKSFKRSGKNLRLICSKGIAVLKEPTIARYKQKYKKYVGAMRNKWWL
jgi:hypothetical protein